MGGACSEEQYAQGTFCQFEDGVCGARGHEGVCRLFEACTSEFDPVCGCDGKTYTHRCEASVSGNNIDHEGECKNDPLPEKVKLIRDCQTVENFTDTLSIERNKEGEVDLSAHAHTATIKLSWSRGCASHELYFCWDGNFEPLLRTSPMPEESEKVHVVMHHNANNDACEAHEIRKFEVDLTPIEEAWIQQFENQSRLLRLVFKSAADPQRVRAAIRYEF